MVFRISPRQSFQRCHKYLLSLLQTLETVLLPPSAGFPHAYLSLSCNSAWNLVCATSTTTPKAGFIFLILQMRTAEAHRDRRQLAQDSTLAKGLDSRFVASRVHRSLHHTASSPGGGLAGGDICYLTAPLPQVYMDGTPKLLQVRSTVLRCGRRWVLESAFHVAEEFQM